MLNYELLPIKLAEFFDKNESITKDQIIRGCVHAIASCEQYGEEQKDSSDAFDEGVLVGLKNSPLGSKIEDITVDKARYFNSKK